MTQRLFVKELHLLIAWLMPAITPDEDPLPIEFKTWTAHSVHDLATPYVLPHAVPETWVLGMSCEKNGTAAAKCVYQ